MQLLSRALVRTLLPTLVLPLAAAVQVATTAPAEAATRPGSAPVGSTSYKIPAGAVFAVAHGGTGGSGTRTSPYQSAQTAVNKARNGATIVLRKGVYRETLEIPFNKKLTIQAAPHEEVWFDGSRRVTGWTKQGTVWVRGNWNHLFDTRVSLVPGADEKSRYVDSAHPMAGDPSAVWVAGHELRQVASASAVRRGTFYVDRSNKRLLIGSDPSGKRVDAAVIQRAMKIQGAGTTFRGIGVRRYATPLSLQGAISYQVNDLTFENMVVKDNSTIGFWGWGDRATFRHVTVSGNGILGLAGDSAPGLRILSSVFRHNNDERFKEQPISSGVKLANSDGVTVSRSVFSRNTTNGLWLDVSMRNVRVVGNRITDNGAAGLEVELSGHVVAANNYIARNREGVFLMDSNDVHLWNNTLNRNARSIQVLQDERRQSNSSLRTSVPWVTKNIEIHNNAIVYGTNFCPLLTQDLTQRWYGRDFDINSNGNVFHRSSSTAPSRFACWANGSAGTMSFPSLSAFQSSTSNDRASKLYQGSNILASDGDLTASVRSATASVPLGLPSNVASAIGRTAGERALGAYLVR